MRTISVLSPMALGPADARRPAAALATLDGARLGLRVDRAWRSFAWFADEIASIARRRFRLADVLVFDPDVRIGSPDTEREKIQHFAADVDAAIIGLGT